MYSPEQIEQLEGNFINVTQGLQDLQLTGVMQARAVQVQEARKYVNHGASRRLGTLKKTLEEIFRVFPVDTTTIVPKDALLIAQIHLQAFILNVTGVFDNWAWAFIHRHGLLQAIGSRRNVSMFIAATQNYLPAAQRNYLRQAHISTWYNDFHKAFRDALAHRIPVYIPPAYYTDAEADRYRELEEQKTPLIQAHAWDQLEEVEAEQEQLGTPCALFVHEYPIVDGAPFLHPQLISDAMTVLEFGQLFYATWHERT